MMEDRIELIFLMLMALCIYVLVLHFEHKKQLFMLQAKLDLLLKQKGLKFDWLEQLPEKLRQQLLQVKEKEGIWLIRHETGLDLIDAKALLEQYKQQHPESNKTT
jgi:hypothetical protein